MNRKFIWVELVVAIFFVTCCGIILIRSIHDFQSGNGTGWTWFWLGLSILIGFGWSHNLIRAWEKLRDNKS